MVFICGPVYDQIALLEVEAGQDGVYVADFSGMFDLGFGEGGRA